MARCPFAQWMPLPWNAGSYTAGPFRIVHHTTEGSTAQGAFEEYQKAKHAIPHFTVDATTIYQHLDTTIAARALAHPAGTVETNRLSAVQMEIVGFAGRPKSRATLHNVGLLCRWIEHTHGVPQQWPNGLPNPPKNGGDPGHHNRNVANWTAKGGHYGHCHVPSNSHWDPAYTAEEAEFVMSVQPASATQLVAEAETFSTMAATSGPRSASRQRTATRPRATKAASRAGKRRPAKRTGKRMAKGTGKSRPGAGKRKPA